MNRLILFLALILAASPQSTVPAIGSTGGGSGATRSFVQGCATTSAPKTNPTCVFGSSDTTGNYIGILYFTNSSSPNTPTMTGATFTQISATACVSSYRLYFYVSGAITGGQTTISVTDATNATMHAAEMHGITTGADGTPGCNANNTTGSPVTCGISGTPSVSGEIALAGVRQNTTATTFTAVSPYTLIAALGDNFASEYGVTGGSATTPQFNYTGSNGNSFLCAVQLFK